MAKRFDTLIDVYDHILPSWSTWDLLAVAPSEQCEALNIEGASRYRLSDGKYAVEVWVILDFEGIYRRAPMELEIEFNRIYHNHPADKSHKSQAVVGAPSIADERADSVNPTLLHSPPLTRKQPGKSQLRQSWVDTRLQNVT